MSSDEDVNPYELLGLGIEATDADIRKAYRTRSLKVHPDRVSAPPLNATPMLHTDTRCAEPE